MAKKRAKAAETKLADVQEIDQRILGSKTALRALEEERGRRLSELRTAILDGCETTGSELTDYLVCAYGRIDTAFEVPFRQLDARLKDHAGELAVVTYEVKTMVRHVMMPAPGFGNIYDWNKRFVYGVLEGDSLVFERIEKKGGKGIDCRLPVPALFGERGDTLQPAHEPLGGFGFEEVGVANVPRILSLELAPLLYDGQFTPDRGQRSGLIIGDQAVKAWLVQCHPDRTFEALCEKAGRLVLTAPKEEEVA